MSHLSRIDWVGRTRLRLVSQGAKQLREPCFTRCSRALSPRAETSGRSCPRTSSTRPRVPARESQPGASCPRTRSPGARVSPHAGAFPLPIRRVSLSRSPRCAVLLAAPSLAAPFSSPRRAARRRYAAGTAPPAALLATVALLHISLVGIAFLHAQSPRSAQ